MNKQRIVLLLRMFTIAIPLFWIQIETKLILRFAEANEEKCNWKRKESLKSPKKRKNYKKATTYSGMAVWMW